MLRTRILTALAILPVVLGMLFLAKGYAWACFALLMALVACWEWSRLCGFSTTAQRAYLAFSGSVGGGLLALYWFSPKDLYPAVSQALLWAAAAFWAVAVPLWLARKLRPPPAVVGLAGWLALWPFWIALVDLRDRNAVLLLGAAVIVWIADIAAYFSGRAFGRRKLAPAISPNKTWEGVYGAIAGVTIYGVAVLAWASDGFAVTAQWAVMLAALAFLTAASIVGDLFESWLKRVAGVKDSSQLLPGHGGVLDRIDALLSTLPLAALLVSMKGSA